MLDRQQPDGGFTGREGNSDLYYSGFGLRSLAVLGELKDNIATKSAEFLRGRLTGHESIVDFLSLMYSARLLAFLNDIDIFEGVTTDWRSAVVDKLNALRRDDGGFAKGEEGHASSTYHTFLVMICLELLDAKVPQPEKIVEFLKSQNMEEGGFREIRVSKRAGTNPTAAAVATLRMLDALDEELSEGAIDFLCEMQNDEGGFRANTRIPIADLLSTFTSIVALRDLNALGEIDKPHALKYAKGLEGEEGGFLGAAWDEKYDVEYTFYGLGTIALLTNIEDE
jgi:geranylgeranyl transferase type-2 subunit beta